MKGPKKLIVVPETVLRDLMGIAKRTGLTISELASLMLAHAARMLQGRDNITTIFRDSVMLADTKRLGAVVIPNDALLALLEGSSDEARTRFINHVREFARTATVYLKAHGVEDLEPKDIISLFTPFSTIDTVDGANGEKRLIISLSQRNSSELLASYVRDIASTIIEEMGYQVLSSEKLGSIVIIEYRDRKKKKEEP